MELKYPLIAIDVLILLSAIAKLILSLVILFTVIWMNADISSLKPISAARSLIILKGTVCIGFEHVLAMQ